MPHKDAKKTGKAQRVIKGGQRPKGPARKPVTRPIPKQSGGSGGSSLNDQ